VTPSISRLASLGSAVVIADSAPPSDIPVTVMWAACNRRRRRLTELVRSVAASPAWFTARKHGLRQHVRRGY
jgi:hypothetical protein